MRRVTERLRRRAGVRHDARVQTSPGWPAGSGSVPVPVTHPPAPGWYPDPWSLGQQRWWDGRAWSAATRPGARATARQRIGERTAGLGTASATTFGITGALTLLVLVAELGPAVMAVATLAAVLPLPLYAWSALLLDRLHPEPGPALVWTATAGSTAVVLWAVVVNSSVEGVLTVTAGSAVGSAVSLALVAPVVEEVGKAAVLVALHRRYRHQITGPLDGVVYAAMVGLGFATVENVLYYGRAIAEGELAPVFVVRGVLSPFAHPVFTACTGIGLGLLAAGRTRVGRAAPALGLLAAVGLHALWNGSTLFGGGAVLLMFLGVMVPVFVGLILLCRAEARREQRTIRAQLRTEVAAGVLTEADVHVLSDVGARRRLLKAAARVHPQAGALLHELTADLLELANVRDRLGRGAFSTDVGPPALFVADLERRVAQARWALPPPPPAAAWTGLSGALGVPLPPSPA